MRRFLALVCLTLCLFGGFAPQAQTEPLPDSHLTYLYVPACQSCAKVASLLDSLGEQVTVTTGDGIEHPSRLVIERVDISARPEVAEALFHQHGTPEADRIVPSVYLGSRYLTGADSILEGLPQALARGEGLAPEGLPAASTPVSSTPLSLGASLGAGLIAGLNPCALSMLILLLGSVLHLGRRSALLAAVYLLTKLLTYFLIGWLLLRVLQVWNPGWLSVAVKWLLSLVAGALILFNLLDAWRAARGEYGRVRNQLPSSLRRRLQEGIKRLAASPHLLWGMVLLGIGVSLGEFLCSGQLYLATLLSGISKGAPGAQQLSLLAAYCLAFILPSAVLTLVILRLRHTLMASDFIRRRMPLIKLLTALVLALAILYAWRV